MSIITITNSRWGSFPGRGTEGVYRNYVWQLGVALAILLTCSPLSAQS
jgi:hypothetical protein